MKTEFYQISSIIFVCLYIAVLYIKKGKRAHGLAIDWVCLFSQVHVLYCIQYCHEYKFLHQIQSISLHALMCEH